MNTPLEGIILRYDKYPPNSRRRHNMSLPIYYLPHPCAPYSQFSRLRAASLSPLVNFVMTRLGEGIGCSSPNLPPGELYGRRRRGSEASSARNFCSALHSSSSIHLSSSSLRISIWANSICLSLSASASATSLPRLLLPTQSAKNSAVP